MAETAAVRPASEPGAATIVVGFDCSAASLLALRAAADLGRRLGARLAVVHAIDLADYPVDPDAGDWEMQAKEALAAEREVVATELAGYETGWVHRCLRAPAGDALTRVADDEDALMIVVGMRQYGLARVVDHLLDPPVSRQVIKHSGRAVLVVPER